MLAVVGGGFLVWFNIRIDGGLAGTELQCWGALDLSEIWPGSTIPASATLHYKKLEQNGVDLFLYVSKIAESVKRERGRRCVIQCFDSVGTDWLESGLWPYQILTMLLSPGNLMMMINIL